jgi:hypothetical protein
VALQVELRPSACERAVRAAYESSYEHPQLKLEPALIGQRTPMKLKPIFRLSFANRPSPPSSTYPSTRVLLVLRHRSKSSGTPLPRF